MALAVAALDCGGGSGAGAQSADAALASLRVNAGTLAPAFASGTTRYALTVPVGTAALTVTPVAHDPRASALTVSQDGGAPVAIASSRPSAALAVPAAGAPSTVTVVVAAQDRVTRRTYAIALTQAPAAADPCGAADPVPVVDPALPPEPTIPPACPGATLAARFAVDAGTGLPVFDPAADAYDTARIQAAVDACAASLGAGQQGSVRLGIAAADATRVGFVSGPLDLRRGVTLWVDDGVTLFASRNPRDYDVSAGTPSCGTDADDSSSGCLPLVRVEGSSTTLLADAGIMGRGVIAGLGGEPMIGGFGGDPDATWWDVAQHAKTAGRSHSNPRLVDVTRATGFVLYGVTFQDSPKVHIGLESGGFVVWGVTIQTPSRSTNSVGRPLSAAYARNTDGIDPSNAGDGWILFSRISTGDDQIALKCGKHHLEDATDAGASCRNITIAHDHLGTGHGMSIGSETNGGATDGTGLGVDGLHVYDLSVDGLLPTGGAGDVNLNGLRIKSDPTRGGIVRNVTYEDVCMRGLANPVIFDPRYGTSAAGTAVPTYDGITLRSVRHVDCSASAAVPAPVVTLAGYDPAHLTRVALDDVIVDGLAATNVHASYASVTLGPGPVNLTPSGTGVTTSDVRSNSAPPDACAGKFVAFPALP
ncbi:MAG TPA: glycosyl hydrolase family 28 protein [Anaeromyxobacteraceae bacterium]|nr:glycosyl hydrolase family 28 protein [Anaeromyxobacteraceae bacterium]